MTSIEEAGTLAAVQVDTCVGSLKLQWLGDVICRLRWEVSASTEEECTPLDGFLADATPAQRSLVESLVTYAEGEYVSFRHIPVAFPAGTNFQKRIWRACQQIPYGETVTYGQLAELAGHPGAARAVGNAMSKNQVPLIIPCHRVVAAGNKLGGFSSPLGIPLKKRLLELERRVHAAT